MNYFFHELINKIQRSSLAVLLDKPTYMCTYTDKTAAIIVHTSRRAFPSKHVMISDLTAAGIYVHEEHARCLHACTLFCTTIYNFVSPGPTALSGFGSQDFKIIVIEKKRVKDQQYIKSSHPMLRILWNNLSKEEFYGIQKKFKSSHHTCQEFYETSL